MNEKRWSSYIYGKNGTQKVILTANRNADGVIWESSFHLRNANSGVSFYQVNGKWVQMPWGDLRSKSRSNVATRGRSSNLFSQTNQENFRAIRQIDQKDGKVYKYWEILNENDKKLIEASKIKRQDSNFVSACMSMLRDWALRFCFGHSLAQLGQSRGFANNFYSITK